MFLTPSPLENFALPWKKVCGHMSRGPKLQQNSVIDDEKTWITLHDPTPLTSNPAQSVFNEKKFGMNLFTVGPKMLLLAATP
jgi:hypothetical protein